MCLKIYLYLVFLPILLVTANKNYNYLKHPNEKSINLIKIELNKSENFPTLKNVNDIKLAAPIFHTIRHELQQKSYLGYNYSMNNNLQSSWEISSNKNTITNCSENKNFKHNSDDIAKVSKSTSTDSLISKRNSNNNINNNNINNNNFNCGRQPRRATRIKRIVGGRNSRFGNHPWQVSLYKPSLKTKPYCGGALLSDRWIVTAAHCMSNKLIRSLTVRLGEYDIRMREMDLLLYEEYKIMRTEIHPEFYRKGRNDVALLKLNKIVNFNWHIIPICLPSQDLNPIGRRATVSGWGRRIENNKQSSPAILNEVDLKVIPNKICQKWFSDAGHSVMINKIYLCAGWSDGGRDACTGDSGGPLTISVDGKTTLIGIVSWGFGCGKKYSPGVYMNIIKFVPWILKTID